MLSPVIACSLFVAATVSHILVSAAPSRSPHASTPDKALHLAQGELQVVGDRIGKQSTSDISIEDNTRNGNRRSHSSSKKHKHTHRDLTGDEIAMHACESRRTEEKRSVEDEAVGSGDTS